MKKLVFLPICLALVATGCNKKTASEASDTAPVSENSSSNESSPEMENKDEVKTTQSTTPTPEPKQTENTNSSAAE